MVGKDEPVTGKYEMTKALNKLLGRKIILYPKIVLNSFNIIYLCYQVSGRVDTNISNIYLLDQHPFYEFRIGGETAIRFGGPDIEAIHKQLPDGGR